MAVRTSAVQEGDVAFDEALPLYGWLEDVDFSRRLGRYGRIVRSEAARGVHLGVKSGRQSGVRLGYSQIANPLYLVRKGSLDRSRAFQQMGHNIAMNLVFSLRPEPYIDRWGRLRGNIKAIKDLLRGRLHPERALTI
jgi:GT2 family glycosyltransferase